jgi:hypothetical protein
VAAYHRLVPIRLDASKQSRRFKIRRSEGARGDGLTGDQMIPARAYWKSTAALLQWSAVARETWMTCYRGRGAQIRGRRR